MWNSHDDGIADVYNCSSLTHTWDDVSDVAADCNPRVQDRQTPWSSVTEIKSATTLQLTTGVTWCCSWRRRCWNPAGDHPSAKVVGFFMFVEKRECHGSVARLLRPAEPAHDTIRFTFGRAKVNHGCIRHLDGVSELIVVNTAVVAVEGVPRELWLGKMDFGATQGIRNERLLSYAWGW